MMSNLLVLFGTVSALINIASGATCKTLKVDVRGEDKTFTSHNDYGNNHYDNNQDRCWIIQSDARIELVVEDFHLQPQDSDDTCVDYVKVYDSEGGNNDKKRVGTFCGRDPFHTIISTGDRMMVEFYSNGDDSDDAGFELKYKIYGWSELDPGAYWKAGLIFLFIFVFVVTASIIAVCAAFYTQKKLKPKVILVKKLKGKATTESRPSTAGAKHDINGQPTPRGHLYPDPLHPQGHYNPDDGSIQHGQMGSQMGPKEQVIAAPFTGHGTGMMEPGFGMTSTPNNEPATSPQGSSFRSRPTTASQIRFD